MASAPKGYILKLESLPLPTTRADRISAIVTALEAGGVHKLIVESGKDLKILRWTKDHLEGLPPEILTDNVIAALRNAELDDCPADDQPRPMQLLFRGFHFVSRKGLRPIHLAVRSKRDLMAWLGVNPTYDMGEVFCVPVLQHNSMPEKTILLIAAQPEDPLEVVYGVRIDMEDAA